MSGSVKTTLRIALVLGCLAFAMPVSAQVVVDLYDFGGDGGGIWPQAKLSQGPDGNLYGTTTRGGDYGYGTIFRMTTSGDVTTIHSFTQDESGFPSSGLLLATDGNFYGTTAGSTGFGSVYRLTPAGVLTTLHLFDQTDGSHPAGELTENDGSLVGVTNAGGAFGTGVAYKLNMDGGYTILHSFDYEKEGGYPVAALTPLSDGNYLLAPGGGDSGFSQYIDGTICEIDASGAATVRHTFGYPDGIHPNSRLIELPDGNFYGTTRDGGAYGYDSGDQGYGTVFQFATSGTLTTLHSFDGTDGEFPMGDPVVGTDGYIYGVTYGSDVDSVNDVGTIYRISNTGDFVNLHIFTGPDGASPMAGLVEANDSCFYGTTDLGGKYGKGVIFKLGLPPPVPAELTATSIPASR